MGPDNSRLIVELGLAALPGIFALYFFFIKAKLKLGLFILVCSAFALRIIMITADPYLHEWDERFHALVAKNMIEHPFRPMLFTRHIMDFNRWDVGGLHIWVHKQPLFLWQMAISMDIFGVSFFGLRLPSAIMASIAVILTYRIAIVWTKNVSIAFTAAFLSTFSFYTLELVSGLLSLDHNDLAFTFYMTCCFWAFAEYLDSNFKLKWALLIGLFSGLAILNKWLVGLLIYGGWVLYFILAYSKINKNKIFHIALASLMTCVVFLPWQLYILKEFPVESAISYEFNRRHIYENLDHPGGVLFHINFLKNSYHIVLLLFLVVGLVTIFINKSNNRKLTISYLAMIFVIFSFFSIIVATKMPAFVFPVSSLIFILMAHGLYSIVDWITEFTKFKKQGKIALTLLLITVAGVFSFKPWLIIRERVADNTFRNHKIHNTNVFKSVEQAIVDQRVILNTRAYENVELMFFKGGIAYHWYPQERILDSLQNLGHKFAAFDYENDPQALPDYIKSDTSIVILEGKLK